jgi:hypothetical protein
MISGWWSCGGGRFIKSKTSERGGYGHLYLRTAIAQRAYKTKVSYFRQRYLLQDSDCATPLGDEDRLSTPRHAYFPYSFML